MSRKLLDVGVLAVVLGVCAVPASAATLCVNPGGTGGCFASIAAAIATAIGAATTASTIDVAPGVYDEPAAVMWRGALTIAGAGADVTTWRSTAPRALAVNGRLRLSGLRIEAPVVVSEAPHAILSDVVLAGDSTDPVAGLSVGDAHLTLERSTITGFAAGLLLFRARADVLASTISGNGMPGLESGGGGIGVFQSKLLLASSTMSGNVAHVGGGIYAPSGSRRSVIRIEHATITDNHADDEGGGIEVWQSSGVPPKISLAGSIVAGNTAGSAGADCAFAPFNPTPPIKVARTSLVAEHGTCTFTLSGGASLLGADPLLGPLADNGGPTETHALSPGSPATAQLATRAACRGTDQSGAPRPTPCDLGALEAP